MIPHRDIPRDALPAVVRTLNPQAPVARRGRVSLRLLVVLFLLWLVALLVAAAVVAAAIMAIRAIGW